MYQVFAWLFGIFVINLVTCKYAKKCYSKLFQDSEKRAAAEKRAKLVKQRDEEAAQTRIGQWKKINKVKRVAQKKYDAVVLELSAGYPHDLRLNQKVRIKGVAGVPGDQKFSVIKIPSPRVFFIIVPALALPPVYDDGSYRPLRLNDGTFLLVEESALQVVMRRTHAVSSPTKKYTFARKERISNNTAQSSHLEGEEEKESLVWKVLMAVASRFVAMLERRGMTRTLKCMRAVIDCCAALYAALFVPKESDKLFKSAAEIYPLASKFGEEVENTPSESLRTGPLPLTAPRAAQELERRYRCGQIVTGYEMLEMKELNKCLSAEEFNALEWMREVRHDARAEQKGVQARWGVGAPATAEYRRLEEHWKGSLLLASEGSGEGERKLQGEKANEEQQQDEQDEQEEPEPLLWQAPSHEVSRARARALGVFPTLDDTRERGAHGHEAHRRACAGARLLHILRCRLALALLAAAMLALPAAMLHGGAWQARAHVEGDSRWGEGPGAGRFVGSGGEALGLGLGLAAVSIGMHGFRAPRTVLEQVQSKRRTGQEVQFSHQFVSSSSSSSSNISGSNSSSGNSSNATGTNANEELGTGMYQSDPYQYEAYPLASAYCGLYERVCTRDKMAVLPLLTVLGMSSAPAYRPWGLKAFDDGNSDAGVTRTKGSRFEAALTAVSSNSSSSSSSHANSSGSSNLSSSSGSSGGSASSSSGTSQSIPIMLQSAAEDGADSRTIAPGSAVPMLGWLDALSALIVLAVVAASERAVAEEEGRGEGEGTGTGMGTGAPQSGATSDVPSRLRASDYAVWVRGLPATATEESVQRHFSERYRLGGDDDTGASMASAAGFDFEFGAGKKVAAYRGGRGHAHSLLCGCMGGRHRRAGAELVGYGSGICGGFSSLIVDDEGELGEGEGGEGAAMESGKGSALAKWVKEYNKRSMAVGRSPEDGDHLERGFEDETTSASIGDEMSYNGYLWMYDGSYVAEVAMVPGSGGDGGSDDGASSREAASWLLITHNSLYRKLSSQIVEAEAIVAKLTQKYEQELGKQVVATTATPTKGIRSPPLSSARRRPSILRRTSAAGPASPAATTGGSAGVSARAWQRLLCRQVALLAEVRGLRALKRQLGRLLGQRELLQKRLQQQQWRQQQGGSGGVGDYDSGEGSSSCFVIFQHRSSHNLCLDDYRSSHLAPCRRFQPRSLQYVDPATGLCYPLHVTRAPEPGDIRWDTMVAAAVSGSMSAAWAPASPAVPTAIVLLLRRLFSAWRRLLSAARSLAHTLLLLLLLAASLAAALSTLHQLRRSETVLRALAPDRCEHMLAPTHFGSYSQAPAHPRIRMGAGLGCSNKEAAVATNLSVDGTASEAQWVRLWFDGAGNQGNDSSSSITWLDQAKLEFQQFHLQGGTAAGVRAPHPFHCVSPAHCCDTSTSAGAGVVFAGSGMDEEAGAAAALCATMGCYTPPPAPHITPPPSLAPTSTPTTMPTPSPTAAPTHVPTSSPTAKPTIDSPANRPTRKPTLYPTKTPTAAPTPANFTYYPTPYPTPPTEAPIPPPTPSPTKFPTATLTSSPTPPPSESPTLPPTPHHHGCHHYPPSHLLHCYCRQRLHNLATGQRGWFGAGRWGAAWLLASEAVEAEVGSSGSGEPVSKHVPVCRALAREVLWGEGMALALAVLLALVNAVGEWCITRHCHAHHSPYSAAAVSHADLGLSRALRSISGSSHGCNVSAYSSRSSYRFLHSSTASVALYRTLCFCLCNTLFVLPLAAVMMGSMPNSDQDGNVLLGAESPFLSFPPLSSLRMPWTLSHADVSSALTGAGIVVDDGSTGRGGVSVGIAAPLASICSVVCVFAPLARTILPLLGHYLHRLNGRFLAPAMRPLALRLSRLLVTGGNVLAILALAMGSAAARVLSAVTGRRKWRYRCRRRSSGVYQPLVGLGGQGLLLRDWLGHWLVSSLLPVAPCSQARLDALLAPPPFPLPERYASLALAAAAAIVWSPLVPLLPAVAAAGLLLHEGLDRMLRHVCARPGARMGMGPAGMGMGMGTGSDREYGPCLARVCVQLLPLALLLRAAFGCFLYAHTVQKLYSVSISSSSSSGTRNLAAAAAAAAETTAGSGSIAGEALTLGDYTGGASLGPCLTLTLVLLYTALGKGGFTGVLLPLQALVVAWKVLLSVLCCNGRIPWLDPFGRVMDSARVLTGTAASTVADTIAGVSSKPSMSGSFPPYTGLFAREYHTVKSAHEIAREEEKQLKQEARQKKLRVQARAKNHNQKNSGGKGIEEQGGNVSDSAGASPSPATVVPDDRDLVHSLHDGLHEDLHGKAESEGAGRTYCADRERGIHYSEGGSGEDVPPVPFPLRPAMVRGGWRWMRGPSAAGVYVQPQGAAQEVWHLHRVWTQRRREVEAQKETMDAENKDDGDGHSDMIEYNASARRMRTWEVVWKQGDLHSYRPQLHPHNWQSVPKVVDEAVALLDYRDIGEYWQARHTSDREQEHVLARERYNFQQRRRSSLATVNSSKVHAIAADKQQGTASSKEEDEELHRGGTKARGEWIQQKSGRSPKATSIVGRSTNPDTIVESIAQQQKPQLTRQISLSDI